MPRQLRVKSPSLRVFFPQLRDIYIGKERENLSTKRSDVLRRTADAFMRFESWTQAVHFLGYALFTQMFYIPLSKPTFRASAHLERLFIPSIVASSLSQVRITCPMFASSSKEERTNRSSIRSFIPWILWPISRRESFKFTNSSLLVRGGRSSLSCPPRRTSSSPSFLS